MRRLGAGARMPTFDLPLVRADRAGHFSVPAASGLSSAMFGPGGQLDLLVTADNGRRQAPWAVSVVPTKSGGWQSTALTPSQDVRAVTLELGTRASSFAQAANKTAGAVPAARARVDGPGMGCTYWRVGPRGPADVKVADVWGTSLSKGRIIYTGSTTHTLGVGYSPPGSSGWSADGTSTRAAGGGFDTNFSLADAAVFVKWAYYEVRNTCGGAWLYPDYLYSGPSVQWSPHQRQRFACQHYYPTWKYERNVGSNASYSTGVNVGGVGMYAQAGWSTATTLSFLFNRDGGMCASSASLGLWYSPFVSADVT